MFRLCRFQLLCYIVLTGLCRDNIKLGIQSVVSVFNSNCDSETSLKNTLLKGFRVPGDKN